MLSGPAHHETVQGLQLHATPSHQIVMQRGEAPRLYGLRQGQDAVPGGLRHRAAIRLGHRAYLCNQPVKGRPGNIYGADLPDWQSHRRGHAGLSAKQAEQVAPLLKALADPVRLRLMSLIASHPGGEACVCDLTGAFDLSQPTISHHLKVLHDSGLLAREKRGIWVYYRACTDALASLGALIGNPRQ
jgi:ArsR family transcriptional regulator, arsenate/arsenite/antimonite-responsive transcriptional repressor